MDKATQTMIENLEKNTGKPLKQWVSLVNGQNFSKHGETIKYLKENHGLTHGFANLIAHKARSSDAASAADPNDLINRQYEGKEHLRLLYEQLMQAILQFGEDVEIAPKNAYVSLRRKKQFALLQPATKTRFEIGINLKGYPAEGKLEEIQNKNAMCSHKINIHSSGDIDSEVIKWIKTAYNKAG